MEVDNTKMEQINKTSNFFVKGSTDAGELQSFNSAIFSKHYIMEDAPVTH